MYVRNVIKFDLFQMESFTQEPCLIFLDLTH